MPETKQEIKQLVRICNSDLNGNKSIYSGLRGVKGIDFSFSNAICIILNLDRKRKIGELSKEELSKIEDVIKNPLKYDLPIWMLNRRKDFDTGEDKHLNSTDIQFVKENDIKRLRMIRSYRGVRHGFGLPVRGQRTKTHFNKGKGKGKTVGVVKKAKGGKKGK
ncbi:MAG: 30S ribosomal protein S13 [Candidatus Nanoarchaeia archaeon]|nr:30S ribosomal protein S13 [Candidatus Nanoarchaeia archaeon]